MAFVVDNSVVIAWVNDNQATPYTRAVFRRLSREAAHVPAIWPFEFVSVLRKLERRGKMQKHKVDAAVNHVIPDLGVRVESDPADQRALLDLARKTGLSAYDASYIELAARLGLPLATKDADLRDAARAVGVSFI